MRVLLALLAFLGSAAAHIPAQQQSYAPKTGIAMFYSPGVMAHVASVRGVHLRTDVDGYAAVPDCHMRDKIALASINGHETERFQILDCSAPADRARHIRQGLVIEVDYASAVRNGIAYRGRGPATVWNIVPR